MMIFKSFNKKDFIFQGFFQIDRLEIVKNI